MIADLTFAAIDFESAGSERGKTDAPVQIGIATWSILTGHDNAFVSYIQTQQPISWAAQKVHGISHTDLQDAPPLLALWPEIKSRLSNNIVVAHGHGTEKRYLQAFPAHGFGPWVDTLQLYRAAFPELPSHTLGDLCQHFKLETKITSLVPHKTWHDALFDAVASLTLLENLINHFNLAQQNPNILSQPDTRIWHQKKR